MPPDFSLDSDTIRPKSRVESDPSFFIRILQKPEPSNAVIPHYPVAPGEGIA